MTRSRTLSAAACCALLTACGPFPDAQMRHYQRPPPAPAQVPQVAPGRAATKAESACFEAGRAAGFENMRLAGSAEVMGPNGLPASRDVMLSVRRGQQTFEVRCSYSYARSIARIIKL
jgi:hypothetical protein